MLPFLGFLSDGMEHSLRDAEDALASHFKLSVMERSELLPSGQQAVFKNRVGWARSYLKKAGLIGTNFLSEKPAKPVRRRGQTHVFFDEYVN